MSAETTDAGFGARLFLIAFGAIAGACLWALTDSWSADVLGTRVFLALFSFASVFFGVSLALTGPLPGGRSLLAALGLALPVTALISWAGLRFADASQFLDNPTSIAVAAAIVFLATPFVSVWMTNRAQWLDYEPLFDTAWAIAVRYVAGWLFVGVFWVVIFLSNALLELVGLDILRLLYELDWMRFALSGAMLGLGLAVAFELRETVSPRLPLQLLRLLLPILLAVVVIFISALPVRGLSGLFGDFSSAGPLMGVAIAGICLISIALDRNDAAGVAGRWMKMAVRALAVMLPLLAGLALWAVWLRVAQYGWTPDRVLAATVAGMIAIYAVVYAVHSLTGGTWRARIRQSNVAMAALAFAVACLWLTPLLHAERLSASSQVMRYSAGRAEVNELPLWEMQAEWGHAGQDALQRLSGMSASPDLQSALEAVAASPTRYAFERTRDQVAAQEGVAALIPLLPVRPDGAVTLTPEMFDGVPEYRIARWLEGCRRGPATAPGCAWVSGAFLPGLAATDQAVILFETADRVHVQYVYLENGRIADRVRELYDSRSGQWADLPIGAVAEVLSGGFSVVPSGISALNINGLQLVPGN